MIEEIKKVEVKKEVEKEEKPKLRQIIMETDGNSVNLTKAEVSGKIELIAVLQTVIDYLRQQK